MKDSGVEWIGEIPKEWVINPLSNKFKEHKVKNIGNTEKNVLSLSYGHIVKRNVGNNKGLLPESFETYNIVFPGNIVLRLTDLQNDQKSWRVGLVKEKGIITSEYLTLEAECNDISNTFYYYFSHIYDRTKIIYNMGNGVRQNLKYSELCKMPIVVPPIKQQTHLASFLDTKCSLIDSTIQKEREVIGKLKEYRQAVITKAVTKGIRPGVPMKDSEVEWIGEIPEGWGLRRLGYLSSMIVPMRDKPTAFDGDIPWIRIEDFDGKYIEKSKSNQNITQEIINKMNIKVYPAGTVLCSCSCTLGICAIVSKAICSNQTFIGIVPNDKIISNYLYYLMSASSERLQYLSSGDLQVYLSRTDFEHLHVAIPKVEEQQEIASFLDAKCSAIDATIQKRELAIEKLTAYKQSLIYECVTGKKEVLA